MNLSEEQLREIERQLSCPEGENGIQTGLMMNESNISMTLASVRTLQLNPKSNILEIGHGNCDHLKHLFDRESSIAYTGLEISETMHAEAKRINDRATANFVLYDGATLPFSENSFDELFTVNTLYFWQNPVAFIREIERVLKKNGRFVLTFASKQSMQNYPFVRDRFTLYDDIDVRELVAQSKLTIKEISKITEVVMSKALEEVHRDFFVVTIEK